MNGLTGFHMLAFMPLAFRSTSHISIPKKLIYYCLPKPDHDYDDDEALAQLPSTQREDVETGMRSSIFQQPKKRGVWAAIDAIWKEKNKHESALRLAKFLGIMQDFFKEFQKVLPGKKKKKY
ncbi:uncharacterized protein LOC116120790 [Pistacia vera]|uniref:uncharacterized protein LOC116120790 n=1 Tax=Pistacia vera TaxID=55513 RepID=UPI0012638F4B|nr:uncharacterized protein LOC116120790 [Pistacia vera]